MTVRAATFGSAQAGGFISRHELVTSLVAVLCGAIALAAASTALLYREPSQVFSAPELAAQPMVIEAPTTANTAATQYAAALPAAQVQP